VYMVRHQAVSRYFDAFTLRTLKLVCRKLSGDRYKSLAIGAAIFQTKKKGRVT